MCAHTSRCMLSTTFLHHSKHSSNGTLSVWLLFYNSLIFRSLAACLPLTTLFPFSLPVLQFSLLVCPLFLFYQPDRLFPFFFQLSVLIYLRESQCSIYLTYTALYGDGPDSKVCVCTAVVFSHSFLFSSDYF